MCNLIQARLHNDDAAFIQVPCCILIDLIEGLGRLRSVLNDFIDNACDFKYSSQIKQSA